MLMDVRHRKASRSRRSVRYRLVYIMPFASILLCALGFLLSGPEECMVQDGNLNSSVASLATEGKQQNDIPLVIVGNMKHEKGFIHLPRRYPLHDHLPSNRTAVAEAIYKKHVPHQEKCWRTAHQSPLFPSPPKTAVELLKPTHDGNVDARLRKAYQFRRQASGNGSPDSSTFYLGYDYSSAPSFENVANPWWVSEKSQHLPCTAEVQRRLFEYQNQAACEDRRFLLSVPSSNKFGLGSVLTLFAHDLLAALTLGRTLFIDSRLKPWWLFVPKECRMVGRQSLDCFYLPPTRCKLTEKEVAVHSGLEANRSTHRVIHKKNFTIPQLDRNVSPSDEVFFGPDHKEWLCYPEYLKWVNDTANMVVHGSFAMGSDMRLNYMLAQAFMYITRAPQPWFQTMLQYHLSPLNLLPAKTDDNQNSPRSGRCVIYIQYRGELAKTKEYYKSFGCHNVGLSAYTDYVRAISTLSDPAVLEKPCAVFLSGGMPLQSFNWLSEELKNDSHQVMSTWNLSTMSAGTESTRWGAASLAASWVDMYAGVASTNWICIVQSNWCRVVNFLRMTHGREHCGFVDFGALLLTSIELREKYCFVFTPPKIHRVKAMGNTRRKTK